MIVLCSYPSVEAHQGKIELERKIGQGATFRVIRPLVLPRKV
jgi:signal transduction histidine kinase